MATPLHLHFRRKPSEDDSRASTGTLPEDIQRIIGMLERLPVEERGKLEKFISMEASQRLAAMQRLELSTDSLRRTVLERIQPEDANASASGLTIDSDAWKTNPRTVNTKPVEIFTRDALAADPEGNPGSERIDSMYVARRLSVSTSRDAVRLLFQDSDTGQVVRTECALPYNDTIDGTNRIRTTTFSFVDVDRVVRRVSINLIFSVGDNHLAKLDAHVVRSVEPIS